MHECWLQMSEDAYVRDFVRETPPSVVQVTDKARLFLQSDQL